MEKDSPNPTHLSAKINTWMIDKLTITVIKDSLITKNQWDKPVLLGTMLQTLSSNQEATIGTWHEDTR